MKNAVLILILLLSFNASATLIGNWTFSEGSGITIHDWQSGFNCTVSGGGANWESSPLCYASDNCLRMQDNNVHCGNVPALHLSNYSAFTWCAWVKQSYAQAKYFQDSYSFFGTSTGYGKYDIRSMWNWTCSDQIECGGSCGYPWNDPYGLNTTNHWRHICITINDSDAAIYMEGNNTAFRNGGIPCYAASGVFPHSAAKVDIDDSNITFGEEYGTVDPFWINNVLLYDIMLSESQIQTLYEEAGESSSSSSSSSSLIATTTTAATTTSSSTTTEATTTTTAATTITTTTTTTTLIPCSFTLSLDNSSSMYYLCNSYGCNVSVCMDGLGDSSINLRYADSQPLRMELLPVFISGFAYFMIYVLFILIFVGGMISTFKQWTK